MMTEEVVEVTRKLATVRRIGALDPIEGADAIECATVDGWKLVVKKGEFEVDDLCVYFEIDSFLPQLPMFEFLRKGCFKSTKNLGDGFRLRTIRLRGQVSQGLALPLTAFPELELSEGEDLTLRLNVQKYEKPIPSNLAGRVRGNFPMFIRKTDQERIQNDYKNLARMPGIEDIVFEVTLKLDGSSMTVYKKDGLVSVCSRNMDLIETEDNTFWKVARSIGLIDALEKMDVNVALQGELMGPGVQGNREKLDKHDFYVFDVFLIDEYRYMGAEERAFFILALSEAFNCNLNHAPLIQYSRAFMEFTSCNAFLEYADRESINHPIAEGVVFKSLDGVISFKAINNKFLLAGGD